MNEPSKQPIQNRPSEPEPATCVPAANQVDGEQLRRRVQELEAANNRMREELVAVQAERDHWRSEAFHWVQKEFDREGILTDEEWQRLIAEEKWLPLEAFIEEIEQLAKEP